jgi:thiamine kinase-like enzyme
MGHNDSQENNVLVKHSEKLELVLIDVEYAGWNPMAFDLANYYAETMFENASKATETGTATFLENMMTEAETKEFARAYLATYYEHYMPVEQKAAYDSFNSYVKEKLAIFVKQIYDCVLLDVFFWGVWSINLLKPTVDSCAPAVNKDFMNYTFAEACVARFELVQKSMNKMNAIDGKDY